jgi:HEAT repeat protein
MNARGLLLPSAVAAAILLAPSGAAAHGGQYRGPGGRAGNDPTAPVGSPNGTKTSSFEAWWAANAWTLVPLKERMRQRDAARKGTVSGTDAPAGDGSLPEAPPFDYRAFFEAEVLPTVTEALRDGDAEVRSAAAVALGKLGFARSATDLRRARKDKVRDVREGALLALGMLREPLLAEDLAAVLMDREESERPRCFAAVGLGLAGGPEAADALLSFLAPDADGRVVGGIGKSPMLEASCLTALGFLGWKDAAARLRDDYASATRYEPALRAYIALALGRLGDREAVPLLLQGLESDREPLRQTAALALGSLLKPADEAPLRALSKAALGDRDINTRHFALMSLCRIGGDEARAVLRRCLERGEKTDHAFAALGLARLGDRDAAPDLRRRLARESDPGLKSALAVSLGVLGDLESAPLLRAGALEQGDRGFRGFCFTALGLMDDRAAAAPVRKWLEGENDPGLRVAGAVCLALLRDADALPVLRRMAEKGDTAYERSQACRVIGMTGDPLSARILLRFVRDKDEMGLVRMHAVAALGAMGDRSDPPLLARLTIDGNTAATVDPIQELAALL